MNTVFTFEEKFTRGLVDFMRELDQHLRGDWKRIDYSCHHARTHYKRVQMIKNDPYVLKIMFGDFNTKPNYMENLVIQYEEQEDKLVITDIHNILHSDGIGIMVKEFDRAYSSEVLNFIGKEIKAIDRNILIQNRIEELKEKLESKEDAIKDIDCTMKGLKKDKRTINESIIDTCHEIQMLENELWEV